MAVTLSFANRVVLITGGSRGIGAACVRLFAEAGGRVAFSYRQARSQAEALVRECGPHNCFTIASELNQTESAQALVAAAVEHYGRLDALVVNHGIAPDELPVDQMTDARWRNTLAVNLDSAFALVRSAVAQMKAQKSLGHIVLISSASGQRGEARLCDYGASKGAIISLTKSLAAELASFGIYVNCVAPGWVNTDMAAPYLNDPALREGILRTIPLRRAGTPEEIAAPVLFLCTPHAGFMTGEIMNVNGGSAMVG